MRKIIAMKRNIIALVVVGVVGLFMATTVFATNNGGANGTADIATCHSNGDGTFSAARASLDDLVAGGYSSGDIVPPFSYYDMSGGISGFSGVNWSGNNLGVYNTGCEENEYSTTSTNEEPQCTQAHPCPNPGCTLAGHAPDDCFNPEVPTVTVTVPGPTTTVTRNVGGGTNTVTVTNTVTTTLPQATTTVQIPGPTVTVIKKVKVKVCPKKPKKHARTP